ncbi:MAG: carbohydrate ABC transporter permease [Ruminiclostridium sp.]
MAEKDFDMKETADVTPVVTDEGIENAMAAMDAFDDNAPQSAEAAEPAAPVEEPKKAEVKAVDNKPAKSKKQLKKEEKERLKKYHVSNWEIIKNYRNYNEQERKHYRYIFGRRISEKVWPIFRFLILFGLAFVIMQPMLYMISTAIRPQSEMSDPSVMWIPKTVTLSNIQDVWAATNYPALIGNTLLVNIICSVLQVVTCSITGYGFARFKFKGKSLMFGIVIMQIIVPVQIILIPQFMQFRYFDIFGIFNAITGSPLNLTDSPWALYLQAFFCNGIRAGLFIFLFRQFFRGLPKELEDAAYLDGCGPFQTFVRIMVPNARTSFLTVFIFSVVWYWNDSYVSGMFYTKSNTVALAIQNMFNTISTWLNGGIPQGTAADYLVWIEAGCLLSLIPILIMYIFLQKYFVEGLERSGITGM